MGKWVLIEAGIWGDEVDRGRGIRVRVGLFCWLNWGYWVEVRVHSKIGFGFVEMVVRILVMVMLEAVPEMGFILDE
ncbi:hypothetical protein AKJ16_DCAP11983 [Drosera capensis]